MPTILNYAPRPQRAAFSPTWWPLTALMTIPVIQPFILKMFFGEPIFPGPPYDAGGLITDLLSMQQARHLVSLLDAAVYVSPSLLGLLLAIVVAIKFKRRPRPQTLDVVYLYILFGFLLLYTFPLLLVGYSNPSP